MTPRCFIRLYLPQRQIQADEDLGAEEAVALRFECAVVDGLRLGDFTVGPRPDLLGRREADLDGVEVVDRLLFRGLKECVK